MGGHAFIFVQGGAAAHPHLIRTAAAEANVIPTGEGLISDFEYSCSCCGERHRGIPDLSFDAPAPYAVLTPEEREVATLTDDYCQVGEHQFVRGVLEIPVHDLASSFGYGVWVSLSAPNFSRYLETFSDEEPSQEQPWFGWFCNQVPGYPPTLSLKTRVHLRGYPDRPRIELEPTDHPLAVEQREGISVARLREILEQVEHPERAV